MRQLFLWLKSNWVIVGPTPRGYLSSLETLLQFLQQRYSEMQCLDETCWESIERITALLPRVDKPGTWGFNPRQLSIQDAEAVFIAQVDEQGIKPCKLIELHQWTAPIRQSKKRSDEITPSDVPIPSSGIPDADTLAALINIDDSVEGALKIWYKFDSHMISAIISQLNELRRDPNERVSDYLNERFEEWKAENRRDYLKALGIG